MPRDREREVKVSEAQKLALLEFMEQNEDFAKGKLLTSEKKQTWTALWETLTSKLNSLDGATKTTTKWQRAWSDLKNKVKRKAKEIRQLRMKGQWNQLSMKLTEFEKRLMLFVADDYLYGIRMYNENDKIVMEIDDSIPNDATSVTTNTISNNEDVKLEIMEIQINSIPSTHSNKAENEMAVEPVSLNIPVNPPKKGKKPANKTVKKIRPQEYMRKKLELFADIGKELKKTNNLLYEFIIAIREKSNKMS